MHYFKTFFLVCDTYANLLDLNMNRISILLKGFIFSMVCELFSQETIQPSFIISDQFVKKLS